MKRFRLQELIKHITREVLKEYSVMSSTNTSTSDPNVDPNADPSAPPVDAMTPLEKSKAERDALKKKTDDIKNGELDLKNVKKQSDYYNQVLKKNKLDVVAKQKEFHKKRVNYNK